jgi:hypothetical protein
MSFRKFYVSMYPNEQNEVSKEMYSRRKFKVLRSMTKEQLLKCFSKNKEYGQYIKKSMTKTQILHVLKKYSWMI